MNNAISPDSQAGASFQQGGFVRKVGASFRHLYEHPALAWITPQLPVRLIEAGGGESLWLGVRKLEAGEAELRSARFTAVEIPGDLALSRRLVLPQLSGRDLHDAVALEVRDSNPFDPSDLVWGHRSAVAGPGQVIVTTVLASRGQVTQFIGQAVPQLAHSPILEAWVMADDGLPVPLRGFGEAARARRATRGRALTYGLIVLALMLAVAMAVTPTVQLRLRTLQAAAAYRVLLQRAGPAMAQREALVRGREDLANLLEVMNDHIEPLVAIDMLTQLIPDDTWLQRVQAQGSRFTLSGQTPNAAALMNTLSSNSGLRDVRAPAPATRGFGSNRESFVVEFTVAPGMLLPTVVGVKPTAAFTTDAALPVLLPQPTAPLVTAAASAPPAAASQPAKTASAPSAKAQP